MRVTYSVNYSFFSSRLDFYWLSILYVCGPNSTDIGRVQVVDPSLQGKGRRSLKRPSTFFSSMTPHVLMREDGSSTATPSEQSTYWSSVSPHLDLYHVAAWFGKHHVLVLNCIYQFGSYCGGHMVLCEASVVPTSSWLGGSYLERSNCVAASRLLATHWVGEASLPWKLWSSELQTN